MRRLFPLSLIALLVLILAGCSTATQPIQTTTEPTTTQTQTTKTQMATENKPATFSVSDLTFNPREPATGELFTISINVTNTGGSQGSYDAILVIDNILIENSINVTIISTETFNKSEIIAAGESKNITFDSLTLQDGIYTATIGDLVDYIEVGC